VFDAAERLLYWLSSFGLQNDVDSICQIDHSMDDHTFVTNSGSLVTFFNIIGSRRYIGEAEFDDQSAALGRELSVLLKAGFGGKQHSICFGFRSDRSGGRARLVEMFTPSMRTAQRFGADAAWLFKDRLDALSAHVSDEVAVFGLMTHRAGLTPAERKRAQEEREAKFSKMAKDKIKLHPHTQMSVMTPPSLLASRHRAAVATIDEKISSMGGAVKVMIDKMNCHQAGRMFRRFAEAGDVPGAWRPQLTSDFQGALTIPRNGEAAVMALPKRLSRQIVTEKISSIFGDAEIAKRGQYYYSSLVLEIPPQDGDTAQETPSFSSLAAELGSDLPWQVHFDIVPNGLDYNQMEKMFAGIYGAAGDHNKSIKAAWDELNQMKRDGTYVAALRAVFTTWATSERQVVDRLAFMRSKVEAWGQTVVTNETAAPAHALLASIPGFCGQIPADLLPGPMESFVRMMPAFRPSSVWPAGQIVCYTNEGRPYPISLGTSLQNFWGTLVFAPTGSGKSFMMNMLNSGALFSPGLTELPMITVIDKGPSAKSFVDLAKAMLPPQLASQIAYLRPTTSDASFVVNPFDTQLGCDKPLPVDRDFISALLLTMAPNLGPEGGKFVNMVVDVVYSYYSRRSPTAKRWQLTLNRDLSAKLDSVGIAFDENKPPRVYQVVDAFFEKGHVQEAAEAQLYAVPTLTDINTVIGSDPRIRAEYGGALSSGGEPIIDVFTRNLNAAAQQYKLFFGISRFKGSERVMVIDTEGLASASSSEEGKRLYAVTLLFARRLGARNFFLHESDIADIAPPMYMDYHSNRAQRIRSEMKFLEYDEIHNARGIGAVQELLQKDAREGRKYNIVTILSSQELEDFPKELVNNSYNFFILGVGSSTASRELQRTFDLSDSEVQAIVRECTRPGKLFAMFKTNKGMLSQILNTRPGPVESWAYTTNGKDTPIRNALYERYGVKKTLLFLAREFPGGSANAFIEKIRQTMGDEFSDDGITAMVLKKLEPKLHEMET
jgi:intracellular multiplication protein IcmB